MFETIGHRIKYCRSIANMSGLKFVEMMNSNLNNKQMSISTFKRLERNEIKKIKPAYIDAISTFFKNNFQIEINKIWLEYGIGFPPIPVNLSEFDIDQQTYIFTQMLGDSFKIEFIASDKHEPYVTKGSRIIVKKEYNLLALKGKLAYCKLYDNNLYIGIVEAIEAVNNIIIIDKTIVKVSEINLIGQVMWIQRY